MALLDLNPRRGLVVGVGQLAFEQIPGGICARDGGGNLVMSIATGPGFGQRLAAAFADYRLAMPQAGGPRRLDDEYAQRQRGVA